MREFSRLVKSVMVVERTLAPVVQSYPEWSLSHFMTSGNTLPKNLRVEHPSLGPGRVVECSGSSARVQWDRLGSWTRNNENLSLVEAEGVIVLDSHKYSHKNGLSEGTNMKKINMTGQEYLALMEDGGTNLAPPSPSQTILTKQSNFKSDSESTPLSGLDGDGGANPDPREEGKAPSDSPKTPAVASMDEPSRKARIGSGAAGAPNRNSNGASSGSTKKASSGNTDKASSGNTDKASSGSTKKASSGSTSGKPWEKADNKATDSEDSEMNKKNESFTFEDADMEGIMGGNDMDMGDEMTMEHDMGAGEIAVTKEFLVKLLQGVVAANLSDEHFQTIADAIADCCAEDRTLDVADIGTVMSTLKDMAGGQQGGQQDGQQGDQYGGQQDGQQDGEVELMGDAPVEECGDEMPVRRMGEGKLPDALKKHMKGKKGDEAASDDDSDDKEEVKESRRSKAPGRKKLDEAWVSSIPGMSPSAKAKVKFGGTEDDAEIADIKRLAGMKF